MSKLRSTPALVVLILFVMGGAAEAHKLKVFATVTGAVIDGYAYFSPGGRANTVSVTLATNDGVVQAKAITDAEGNFRFEATRRVDYVITVDAGDGHVASTTIAAEDLPQTLSFASGAAAAVRPDERAAAEPRPPLFRAPPATPSSGHSSTRAFPVRSGLCVNRSTPIRKKSGGTTFWVVSVTFSGLAASLSACLKDASGPMPFDLI